MPEADENMEGEEQLFEQVADGSEQAAPMEGKCVCAGRDARSRSSFSFARVVSLRAVAHAARPPAGVVEIQDLSTSANPEEEKLTGSYTVCVFVCVLGCVRAKHAGQVFCSFSPLTPSPHLRPTQLLPHTSS